MNAPPSNPFWEFSLGVYRGDRVAPACLRLQDRCGVDVNLFLYFCWRATVEPDPMSGREIRAAIRLTENWRDSVVRPLRDVRRRMKGGFDGFPHAGSDALRSQVRRLELDAERCQQTVLFESRTMSDCGPAAARRTDHARQNIATYFAEMGIDTDAAAESDCAVIIASCTGT